MASFQLVPDVKKAFKLFLIHGPGEGERMQKPGDTVVVDQRTGYRW